MYLEPVSSTVSIAITLVWLRVSPQLDVHIITISWVVVIDRGSLLSQASTRSIYPPYSSVQFTDSYSKLAFASFNAWPLSMSVLSWCVCHVPKVHTSCSTDLLLMIIAAGLNGRVFDFNEWIFNRRCHYFWGSSCLFLCSCFHAYIIVLING